jgi:hypothetical protein
MMVIFYGQAILRYVLACATIKQALYFLLT